MKLVKIDESLYSQYRYEIIFNGYKWDPQVHDHNTVAPYALILTNDEISELIKVTEALALETKIIEERVLLDLSKTKILKLPRRLSKLLKTIKNYNFKNHLRLLRFDFHPTTQGFKVSEVNSDVPGGFAEASVMPLIAQKYLGKYFPIMDFSEIFYSEYIKIKKIPDDLVAFVYASSYSDDRQVMEFMSDYFKNKGHKTCFLGPDLVKWIDNVPYSKIDKQQIGSIVRFYPLEWLLNLRGGWKGFFQTQACQCNHPISIIAQTKRFPLLWDEADAPYWKKYLPVTLVPTGSKTEIDEVNKGSYIYKPALGRVGEDITIKEAMTKKNFESVIKDVRRHPNRWVKQERFESVPIEIDGTKYHICIGVFSVNGVCAGFYGRISPYPRIDENAKDIPILKEEE